ncbi:MAG: hypothetical protein K2J67_02365 [Lachnospiraceae bacterium]|nr:hypothetical protein [Lachnospiraceae bacterium]
MNSLGVLFSEKSKKKEDVFQQETRHFGPKNKDKILYYIEDKDKNVHKLGFFALYRRWLEYLYFADVCGYAPVIYADSRFSYRESKAVYNTTNPFEYYFIQPAGISLQEAKCSDRVVMSDHIHREMVELILTGKRGSYKYNSRYLHMLAHVTAKYIRFTPHTQHYMDESLNKLAFGQEKILGVHMRGTDYRAMYHDHPVYVKEDECFKEIDKLLGKNLYNKIFIATDDKRILDKFVYRYGDKLCFYEDVERSGQNKSIAFHYSARDRNKYLLGLEVIRDMYTLSMCAGLVAGVSQVAICAQIHKLSRKEKYEDRVIIDKGLYNNQNFFTKRVWQ